MPGVHDRPTLAMVLRPGRKTREFHGMVSREVDRLARREDELDEIAAKSRKAFAVQLATEQAERVAIRREAMLERKWPHGRRRKL